MDQTLTPAQQRARLHQLLDTLPDAAVAAWLQLLDASGTPTTAPAPRGEAPISANLPLCPRAPRLLHAAFCCLSGHAQARWASQVRTVDS